MRILAVENSASGTSDLTALLEAAYPGAEVEQFTDPMLAVKACYARPADIAAAGYDLKRMDGVAFLGMLRRLTPGITAILIDDGDAHRADAENLMLDYLPRPVTAGALKLLTEPQ